MIRPENNKRVPNENLFVKNIKPVKPEKAEDNLAKKVNSNLPEGTTKTSTEVDVPALMAASDSVPKNVRSSNLEESFEMDGPLNRRFMTFAIMSFASEFGLENFDFYQIYNSDANYIISAVQNEVLKRGSNVTLEEAVQIVKDELHRYLPMITDIMEVISDTPGGASLSDDEKEQKARAVSGEINAQCRKNSVGYCSGEEIHRILDDSKKQQIITDVLKAHYPELYTEPEEPVPDPEPAYESKYDDNQAWGDDIRIADFIEDVLLTQGTEPNQELIDKIHVELLRASFDNNLIGLSIKNLSEAIDIMLRGTVSNAVSVITEITNYLLTNENTQENDVNVTCGMVKELILSILKNIQ